MPAVPRKQVVAIREDESDRMLTVARKAKDTSIKAHRDYVFLLLLAHTGMRRAEAQALAVEDLDFDRTPPAIRIRHGKGDRERYVVMAQRHEIPCLDKELDEKLRREWPGVLNWLIAGAVAWQHDGLSEPATPRRITFSTAIFRAKP